MLRFLDKVQDEKGNSIEYWRDRGWVNGNGNFIAGEGYIVQANKNGILIVDETISEKSGVLFAERMETTHFKISYDGNGIEHININIR